MVDIEAVVARFFCEAVGVTAYIEVPAKPADEYVSVEQTGGGDSIFDPVSLSIDCVAGPPKDGGRKRAKAISRAVQAAVAGLDEVECIYNPSVDTVYRQNDPDTGRSRYVVDCSMFVCE